MKYEITWEIDDGYAGGSRPHTFIFDSSDYMDDESWETAHEDERNDIIYEAGQIEFANKVTWYIMNKKIID